MANAAINALDGLKGRLESITGLRVYIAPDSVAEYNCIIINPKLPLPNEEFSGKDMRLPFLLTVKVKAATGLKAWESLLDYAVVTGNKSIKAAIDADVTLGGTVDTTKINDPDPDDVRMETPGILEADLPGECYISG